MWKDVDSGNQNIDWIPSHFCKPLTSTGPHMRVRACRAYTFAVINQPKRLSAASQGTLPGFQELHLSEPRVQKHPGPGCLLLDEKYQLGSGRGGPCVSGQQDWLCLGAGSILLPVPGFLMRGRAAGKFPFLFFPLPLGPWKSRLQPVHLQNFCKGAEAVFWLQPTHWFHLDASFWASGLELSNHLLHVNYP